MLVPSPTVPKTPRVKKYLQARIGDEKQQNKYTLTVAKAYKRLSKYGCVYTFYL